MYSLGIIPAAGKCTRMAPLCVDYSKVMLPYEDKPLIHQHILNMTAQGCDHVIIVVNQHTGNDIRKYCWAHFPNLEFTFAVQYEQVGPVDAIYHGISTFAKANKLPDQYKVFVLMGDTFYNTSISRYNDEDFVGVSSVETTKPWCTTNIVQSVNGLSYKIGALFNKLEIENKPNIKALVGIYNFVDGVCFVETVSALVESDCKIDNECQMSTVLDLYKIGKIIKAIDIPTWIDFGSVSSYRRLKPRISRPNNIITTSDDGFFINKQIVFGSAQKLIRELFWYENIPQSIRGFTPHIISQNVSNSVDSSYVMENIKLPLASDVLMYDPNASITKMIDTIMSFIRHMGNIPTPCQNTNDIANSLRVMYVEKTQRRINSFDKHSQKHVISHMMNLHLNNKPSINELLVEHKARIAALANCTSMWGYIHGDMHLGNIFYEPNSCSMKIIDPRGSFATGSGKSVPSVLGDSRYDIAKLCQSLIGQYDYIINDNFSNDGAHLKIFADSKKHEETVVYLRNACINLGYDWNDIMLITGLLFITLIPFHTKASHITAFCIIAHEFLSGEYDQFTSKIG